MKKINKIIPGILCIVLCGLFASCEKDSAGLTKITYYADIQLDGDSYMVVAKGSDFEDPGFTATMAGKDVTDQVKVTGEVDTSVSGIYAITYSMTNADGFTASVTRTVVVLDLTDPIEGFWAVTPDSYRVYNGANVIYGATYQFLIIGEGDGAYYVEDLLAGWYSQRAGYGSDYNMQAEISVADDGAITLENSYIPGWGQTADYLDDATFDADGKQIVYKVGFNGNMEFNVTLEKVEL